MAGDPRIVGPLSAIAIPLADAGQKFAASTPFQKGVGLACFGAVVLGFCGFFAGPMFSPGILPPARLVFVGVVAGALLLLVIGMRMARGPRDPVMALTSIATPAGFAAALWLWGGPEVFHNGLVEFFGIPFAIGFVLRLFLSLRGGHGSARRVMRRAMRERNAPLRPATGRRRFFWW